MKISEEKKYLYEMMSDITTERRRLTDMYFDIKKRLDELILLETKGLEDIPIGSLVSLHNSRETDRMKENIQKFADQAIQKVEKEHEEIVNPTKPEIIPKKEIELSKEREAKKTTGSRRVQLSSDKVAGLIAQALKENGAPMKVADLYERVCELSEYPIARNNFRNNILPRAMKINKNIDNVQRGYYQYLFK